MAEGAAVRRSAPPRSQRGEETRERVLVAAARLFATQGFDATSVEAVADAAGITVPGMYKHFPAKHGLLMAVARRVTRGSVARQALGQGPDLAGDLAELFGEYLAPGEVERRRLSIELSRAAFGDEELRPAVVSFNARLREALSETLCARHDIDRGEAARLSHLLLVLLMGAVHLDTLDAERIGDPALVEHLRRAFARILADPEPAAARPAPAGLPPSVVDPPEDPVPSDGRRARAVRTRQRILRAAHDLFALHGYDGTTIDAIAARAEITVPGLYRHVTSKEQLLLEVAARAFSRYRLARPQDGTEHTTTQLAELLAAFSLSGERVDRRLAIELDFGAWRSEPLAEDLRTFHRRMRQNVERALVAAGVGEDEDVELRALVFLMLFMGIAHLDTIDPALIDDPEWYDVLRRRLPQLVG